MLRYHVKRLLKECQFVYGSMDKSETVEIICQDGRTRIHILVLASITKSWIKDCLKETSEKDSISVILPSVNIRDMSLFLGHLHDFHSQGLVQNVQDQLSCAISNLSPFFDLDSLTSQPEDFEASEDNIDNTDDINEDNFTDQDGRLVCLVCYKIFNRSNSEMFKLHLLTHPQKPKKKVAKNEKKCTQCTYSCRSSAQLNAHSKIHLNKKFTCVSCHREFSSEKILQNHVKSGTCQLSSRQCQLCQKVFSDSTRLKNHLKTHSGQKPFTCQICDKSFGELRSLKEHKLTHESKRSFACQHCQKSFVQKNHLLYHQASQHGAGDRLHKCEICEKRFAFAFQLKKHKENHQKEKRS